MTTVESIVKNNSLNYPLAVDDENMEKEILKPLSHMTSTPSTNFRQNYMKLLGHWFTVPKDKLDKIDAIIHYAYNGALMLDDVQDNSILRRGIPAAYTVFGVPRVAFAFDWILTILSELLNEMNDLELSKKFAKLCIMSIAGQGLEIYWRENNICPTEAEYLQLAYRKSSLFLLSTVAAMNTFTTGKKIDIEKLILTLGIYFQIRDDYENLCNKVYFENKGFCDDLTEGKFSFPIVHAVNNFPVEGEIIKDILAQRTYDIKVKKYCISILEKCGSFEYTRKKMQELKVSVYEEAGKLDANPLLIKFIEKDLADVVNYH